MHDDSASNLLAADRTDVPGYLDFAVSVQPHDGPTTVLVTGDLDCYTAGQLRTVLWEIVDARPGLVVLDVGATDFIDSTGLGVLVGGAKRLREAGGCLMVRSPSPTTRRLFEITGVTKLFEIVEPGRLQ